MKILHICAIDATAKYVLSPLLRHLVEEHDVHLACTPGPHLGAFEGSGIVVHGIRIPRDVNVVGWAHALLGLRRLMERQAYDVVHTHTPIPNMIGRVAARMARVPMVVTTAHGFYFHEHTPKVQRAAHMQVERALSQITTKLITVSAEDADTALRTRLYVSEQVVWIPNGVDVAAFDLGPHRARVRQSIREGLGIATDAWVVGFVGRLTAEKGCRELIEAVAALAPKLKNLHMLVIGDTMTGDRSTFKATLDALVSTKGLRDRVTFAGERPDVPRVLAAIDVFALPSYREGMPLALMEAMAAGLPVVVSNVRGCRELVRHGLHGLVVPVRDPNALAKGLNQLYEDPAMAARMAHQGKVAMEGFRLEVNLRRHSELYRDMARTWSQGGPLR